MSSPGAPRPELNFRARKILYAVVSEYVATGEPVGSRTLARRYGLNLSPASIRNVLADLEDWGYLTQPHTSAGRVPTDLGFRVFVDALIQMREVSTDDRHAILQSLRPGIDDFAREAGRVLSSLAGAAAVVATPRAESEPLAQLRFIPYRQNELLAVLITRAGKVENRVVRVGRDIDPSELERMHNLLNELLQTATTLDLVRTRLAHDMARGRGEYDELKLGLKHVVDATVAQGDSRPNVFIEGKGLVYDLPEFAAADKLRGVMRTFEEQEHLLELLDRTLAAGGVQVVIGSEAQLGNGNELSLVAAPYGAAGAPEGTVGIIGSTRMDYAKVVPLVGFTARVMSGLLSGEEPREDPNSLESADKKKPSGS